jgi:hypothetical protein
MCQGKDPADASLFRARTTCILKNLTGLGGLRKYFKDHRGRKYLGFDSWVEQSQLCCSCFSGAGGHLHDSRLSALNFGLPDQMLGRPKFPDESRFLGRVEPLSIHNP